MPECKTFTWKESRLMRSLADVSSAASDLWPKRSALEMAVEPCNDTRAIKFKFMEKYSSITFQKEKR